jgi:hypothetical protein
VRAALGGDRFTVRPQGPPYERTTTLGADRAALVRRRAEAGGRFVVVDEGPGLSGSSLISVAEALVGAGAPADRIWLLGTRVVDPATLVTPDGAARWRRFRSLAVPPGDRWPAACDGQSLSGGAWRAHFWTEPARWPAAWTTLERLKRLSADGRWLWKFEGLGRYGAEVYARAEALGRAGWTPPPAAPPDGLGFVPYPFAGRPLERGDPDPALPDTLGAYCAARVALFPAEPDLVALSEMARTNVALEGGVELPAGWQLPCERPIVADARMLPHEWLRGPEGRLWKSDGAAHGDDHLYPGPVDAAWDLAGAIVEWALDEPARQALVARYRARSGDDPTLRLGAHELAYAAFRASACGMAAASSGAGEAVRLLRERERYRRLLRERLTVIGLRRH